MDSTGSCPQCSLIGNSEEGLSALVAALRPLRMNGSCRTASHIANDYTVLAVLQQSPWQETQGQTPLDKPRMEQFRRELKTGAWKGSGALYGTRNQVKE